jgi:hypothetical protein
MLSAAPGLPNPGHSLIVSHPLAATNARADAAPLAWAGIIGGDCVLYYLTNMA